MRTPFNTEVTCICVDFKQFGEITEFQHKGGQKLFFQVFKCLLLNLFSFKRQLLFEEIQKWFHHLRKPFYKLLVLVG